MEDVLREEVLPGEDAEGGSGKLTTKDYGLIGRTARRYDYWCRVQYYGQNGRYLQAEKMISLYDGINAPERKDRHELRLKAYLAPGEVLLDYQLKGTYEAYYELPMDVFCRSGRMKRESVYGEAAEE